MGYGSDVGDLADSYWSKSLATMQGLSGSEGSVGLMKQFDEDVDSFRESIADEHIRTRDYLYSMMATLTGNARSYREQERNNELSIASPGATSANSSTEAGEERFPGINFIETPTYAEPHLKLKRTVEWAIDLISPYHENLQYGARITPIENYLQPIACEWERINPVSDRIAFLEAANRSLVSNMQAGKKWLTEYWTGTGSNAFASASDAQEKGLLNRADQIGATANYVRQGGECIMQLVSNQANGLINDLTHPLSIDGFTLPMTHWGSMLRYAPPKMNTAPIRSKIEAIESAARGRHEEILNIMSNMRDVLRRGVDVEARPFHGASLNLASEIPLAAGSIAYGFNRNVWSEVELAGP